MTDQEIETLQQAITVLELNGNWYLAEVLRRQLKELMDEATKNRASTDEDS